MAFTNAPSQSTQQVKRIPVQGSQGLAADGVTVAPNYINCYPSKLQQFGTDPIHVIEKRPYLTSATYTNFSTSTIPRGFWTDPALGNVCYATGTTVYQNGTNIGSLHYNNNDYVGFTTYRVGSTYYLVIFENHNSAAYMHYWDGAVFTSVALGVGGRGNPQFLDGYIFFAGHWFSNHQRIYNSTIGAPMTFSTATDFLDAEMVNDRLFDIAVHHNFIVAFGGNSIEFFYNNANQLGSPLSRNVQYAQRIGVPSLTASNQIFYNRQIVSIADTLFFIGHTEHGENAIYQLDNFQVKNITNDFLARYLNQYNFASSSSMNTVPPMLTTVMSRGVPVIAMSTYGFSNTTFVTYCYHPADSVWTEWQFYSSQTTYGYTLIATTLDTTNIPTTLAIFRKYKISDGTTTYELDKFMPYENKANTGGEEVTATWVTDFIDFDIDNHKHFRYVDLVGDVGTNTVNAQFTTYVDLTNYLDMGTVSSYSKRIPIRWRQMGNGRGIAFKFKLVGDSNMVLQGLDIAYNQGQL